MTTTTTAAVARNDISVLASTDNNAHSSVQVFASRTDFLLWEVAVEIRANLDYVMDLHEELLVLERRRAREQAQAKKDSNTNNTQNVNDDTNYDDDDDDDVADDPMAVDFLGILDDERRRDFIRQLCCFEPALFFTIYNDIEDSLSELSSNKDDNDKNNDEKNATTASPVSFSARESFLFGTALLLTCILEHRHRSISQVDSERIVSRPWLRHLHWEGVLSYCLWDCIPYLEKKGQYKQAV